jgi:tetratricopeptide (TPR) repeat protein
VRRGSELLRLLRTAEAPAHEGELSDIAIDVLHAACKVIADGAGESPETLLQDAETFYKFASQAQWPQPDLGERAELLFDCALPAWRTARVAGKARDSAKWLTQLNKLSRLKSPCNLALDELLATSPSQRGPEMVAALETTETLICLCSRLRCQLDTSPTDVLREAKFFYDFLEKQIGLTGQSAEGQYFLGELALIAGTACRLTSARDDARLWFGRSESAFRQTSNATAEMSRLAFQRLAVRIEERHLEAVLAEAPMLVETCRKVDMPEEALKCRFLEGLALMESGRLPDAVNVFRQVAREARDLKSEKLLAHAYINLTQLHGILGETQEALNASEQAIPILRRLDHRIGLAKVQWGVGNLLRGQGRSVTAIEAYRIAQREFERIGMRADVAALGLVVADLLLETGRDQEAVLEVLAALPVIDELKLVPEGVAALSLLRDSVRQQRINRQALREVHGYFEETKQ